VTPELTLSLTDAPDAAARAVIASGLDRYNDEKTGIADRRPLAVLVKDAGTGEVVGGILGRSSLGLLFLDLVYLPDALRGQGVGSRMMRMAEEEGRRRGCCAAVLYTISFQAPEFYERLGYRRFGSIPCHPPGTARLFYTKELT
jgi:GNAT superfamily N-acetyltransferase